MSNGERAGTDRRDVGEGLEGEDEESAGEGDPGNLGPPPFGDRGGEGAGPGAGPALVAAPTIAQRSQLLPCLLMWPRRVWSAELRSVGVSPAHEASRSALSTRETSATSATIVAAVRRPLLRLNKNSVSQPAEEVRCPDRWVG